MAVLIGFIETTHTSTTNLIMTVVVPISTAIRVYANYFYYSGLSRILMFTIRFSKKNHDAIFYKFKFYVYIQATTVLSISSVQVCTSCMYWTYVQFYSFRFSDEKLSLYVYNRDEKLIMLSHWIWNLLQIIICPCVLLQFQVE